MKKAYIDTKGGQIHYVYEGKGEPLILLHHAGSSSQEFRLIIPLLSPYFSVIAVDMLGHGNTYHPQFDPSIDDYASVVVNFMDALNLGKANIVGVHTGAEVAIKLAFLHPERLIKLGLYGVIYRNQESMDEIIPETHRKPYVLNRDGSHMLKVWQSDMYYSSEDISLQLLQSLVTDSLRAYKGASAAHRACYYHDTKSELPFIKCPTLLINGSFDGLREDTERALSVIPNSSLVNIDGGTGHIALEKPNELAEIMISFFKD
jgi:pimeloyl-ACP methyl ester carboxylesterase